MHCIGITTGWQRGPQGVVGPRNPQWHGSHRCHHARRGVSDGLAAGSSALQGRVVWPMRPDGNREARLVIEEGVRSLAERRTGRAPAAAFG